MCNFTKEQRDLIKESIPSTYTEDEKNEIIVLLVDLANIYLNADLD